MSKTDLTCNRFKAEMPLALQKILDEKKELDSFRELKSSSQPIDFCSNDYLGLARSQELFYAIQRSSERLKPPYNGSTGSRLLSGNSELAEALENKLAGIFHSPKTLLFNSGYDANLAILSCLPQRGDTIIYDELVHASLRDGARLSLASRFNFRHNDLNDLEEKIKHAKGNIFVVAESIYSMDGDECPLEELVTLSEKYDFSIILDEAHSTGSFGENGSGLAVAKKLENKIAVRIYTFGKAMGVHGACVAGDQALINFLINFARPFIYTTAMSPHGLVSIGCAFDFLKRQIGLQEILQSKINLFLKGFEKMKWNYVKSNSAIQNVIIPGNTNVKELSHFLQHHQFDCRSILSPTVKEGSERIRICLHAFNSDHEITELNHVLSEFEL
jgi:8-amino-7-oxononanoate synthase